MTNLITLTIPNDDSTALYHFGKSLIDMSASIIGAREFVVITRDEYEKLVTTEVTCKLSINSTDISAEVDKIIAQRANIQVDTTPQQVESLARNVVDREVHFDNPTPQVSDATTDSTGTPWDERIHSASKALNADGTWRLRRKPKDMDEEQWAAFVETVKGELSEGLETPAEAYLTDDFVKPPVTHQNPVYMYQESRNVYALGRSEEEIAEYETKGYVRHTQEQYDAWEGPTVADEGDDFHTDADVVTEQTVAGIPPIPVPPPVVVAPPVPEVTEWDFPRLMTFLTERHGKIDVATVNMLLAQDGLASLQELNAHPDKIGPFVARVKAHLGE